MTIINFADKVTHGFDEDALTITPFREGRIERDVARSGSFGPSRLTSHTEGQHADGTLA